MGYSGQIFALPLRRPEWFTNILAKKHSFLGQLFRFLHRSGQLVEYYYPLSFLGTLTLGISIYLSGYAYSTSNIYALLIALLAMFFILALLVFIRLWALRQGEAEMIWESGRSLTARLPETKLGLKLGTPPPPYFFRYHFLLRGILNAGRQENFYYFQEAASSAGGDIRLGFYFPLCGRLSARTKLLVRDVLGLSRTRLGVSQLREFRILPPLLSDRLPLPLYSAATLESRQRRKQSEEEKYYMREYIPGDRLKDINWKASFRIGEMITRIAPQSPEQSRLLYIEFRNLSYLTRDTPLSLLHLNLLKSWLFSFLVQMHRAHPEYRFQVLSAETEDLLATDKDIDNFASVLAEWKYIQTSRWIMRETSVLEKFVFTTAFDPSIRQAGNSGIKQHIFQVQQAKHSKGTLLRLMPLKYAVPWPGWWVLRPTPSPRFKAALVPGSMWRQMEIRTRLI